MVDPDEQTRAAAPYKRLVEAVLAALVHEDPMDLGAPDNDLRDEYESEAREIARRLIHAESSDAADAASAVVETFSKSFGAMLPLRRVARVAAALELGERSVGDLAFRLGDADVVAAFVRGLVAAHGRCGAVTVRVGATGSREVHVEAPPGADAGTERLAVAVLGPGDGEVAVRGHVIELGAGDLGPHQPLAEATAAIEALVVAIVSGTVEWTSVIRRRDAGGPATCPIREEIRFVLPQGPFAISTDFGVGGWGPTKRVTGRAVPYPRRQTATTVEDVPAALDATAAAIDELWDCWLNFSALAVRDGAVRIPLRRSVKQGRWTVPASSPDRVLSIAPAVALDVRDGDWGGLEQQFDGMSWERCGSRRAVRVVGEGGVSVRVWGTAEQGPQIELLALTEREDLDGPRASSVTLVGPDGRARSFADVDAARRELRDERAAGEHRGHDADGFRVTISVTDASSRFRRRTRVRRLLGPRMTATSTTTDERAAAVDLDHRDEPAPDHPSG